MSSDFLTKADVARILGVTPDRVRQLANTGRLKVAQRTPGGVRLFRAADVERFRAEREKTKGGGTDGARTGS